MYYVAKLLQGLGLFITIDALYIGIRYDDMQTEVMLLAVGVLAFFAGRRLERRMSS